MRRLLTLGLLGLTLALAGCGKTVQTLNTAWEAVSSVKTMTIEPKAIIVAAGIFNAAEATATVYLDQKRCIGAARRTCRDPGVTQQLKTAITEGRKVRDQLLAFVEAHPGELGDAGLYDGLQVAINSLQGIFAAYKIGAAS